MTDTQVTRTETIVFDDNINAVCIIPKMHGLGTPYGGNFLTYYLKTDSLPYYVGGSTIGMKFSDDIWDYSPFKVTNIANAKLILDFRDIPGEFKTITKFYCIREMIRAKCKIQSIKAGALGQTRSFLKYAKKHGCSTMIDLSSDLIKDYLAEQEKIKGENSMINIRNRLSDFIRFYSSNFQVIDYILPPEITKADFSLAKAEAEAAKTPDIPEEYFNRLINRLLDLMNDEQQTVFTRTVAAELVILSQTGLRVSEALSLDTDSLFEEKTDDGISFMALKYPTTKNVRWVNTYRNSYTISNDLTTAAFRTIEKLHAESRKRQNTNILFADTGSALAGKYGIDSHQFRNACERFFIHIDSPKLRTIDLEGEDIQCLYRKEVQIGSEMHKIYFPEMPMFRVHMCTSLRRMGVPRAIVERLMSHLSADMADYYYRTEDPDSVEQEDLAFSENIISELQDKNIPLLGGDEINREAIKKFITDGFANVEMSVDNVFTKLEEDLLIRPKPFGFCITAPRHNCGRDIKANKILCYNGSCENDYHMYWNIAANWRQMLGRQNAIRICVAKKHWTEAEQQIKYLARLTKERMVDELASLDQLIKLYGYNELALRHPALEEVFDDYDLVKGEVNDWKDMTLEKYLEEYGF